MCDILQNKQLVLFWVFLGFFLIIGVISLLSIIGVLKIEDRFRKWAITGFIVPVVGVIIAMANIFLTPVDGGIQSDLHIAIENTVYLPKMKEATYEYSRQTDKPERATLNPGPGSLEIVVPYKANYISSYDQLIILKTKDYEGKEWYSGVYPKQIKTTLIPQERPDNPASNSSSYFALSLIKNAFAQTCQVTVTQVKFSNWTRSAEENYGGRDYFKWRVFVDEDAGVLDCIDEVQYELHPTFPNPLQIRRERSNNFAVEMSGWGEFDIKITVKLSNGTVLPVQVYRLDFSKRWPEEIAGEPGQASGSNWQSAFIDLNPPKDFKNGDHLVIRVEGSAEYVKVRLLPETGNPQQPTGVLGDKMKVPPGGKIEVTLTEARPKVKQISVHAGKEAWGNVINPNGGNIVIQRIDLNP